MIGLIVIQSLVFFSIIPETWTMRKNLSNPVHQRKLEKRSVQTIFDPQVWIAIIYTLESVFMSVPFGFIIGPLANFFRVPNRRKKRSVQYHDRLAKSSINHIIAKIKPI